jgi:hypothetical protein
LFYGVYVMRNGRFAAVPYSRVATVELLLPVLPRMITPVEPDVERKRRGRPPPGRDVTLDLHGATNA